MLCTGEEEKPTKNRCITCWNLEVSPAAPVFTRATKRHFPLSKQKQMSGVPRTSRCSQLEVGLEGNSSSMATSQCRPKEFRLSSYLLEWQKLHDLQKDSLSLFGWIIAPQMGNLSPSLGLSHCENTLASFAACLSLDSTTVVNNALRIVLPTFHEANPSPPSFRQDAACPGIIQIAWVEKQPIGIAEMHVITAAKQVFQ